MSAVLLIAIGLTLLGSVLVDLVWTTLGVSHGSGPLTSAVLRGGWALAAPLRRHRVHGGLAVAGLLVVVSTLALWVLLLWVAWSLIFLAPEGGVVDALGTPAGGWDRVYFAGYSLFTLGNGEFQPETSAWQIATVSAALSGLTVISLAIAYLVLVTSAAAERHAVAARISLLGETPSEIVLGWWPHRDSTDLGTTLQELIAPIVELTQRHLAYPVLHFFHTADHRMSPPVAIMRLDDALTLLEIGIAPSARPSEWSIPALRRAIDDYLVMVGHHYGDDDPRPTALSVSELADRGLPVVSPGEFQRLLAPLAGRRSAMRRLVAAEGFGADRSSLA